MQARAVFICAFFVSAISSGVWGQYISDQAILHVGENAVLSTERPLLNSGFVANEGTILLRSEWNNQGIYQGAGTLIMGGTTTQTFTHNGQHVARLELINLSGVLLRGKLHLSNSLLLEEGNITTSADDTLYIDNDALIEGGSPQAFVNGPLHRGGRGQRFFPIGINNTYLPVTLADVSGGNTIVTLEALQGFGGAVPAGISEISREFYWRQSSYRDAYTGSEVVLPLYNPQMDVTTTVVLGYTTDYTVYDDLSFSTGTYYQEAATNEKVGESLFLLAMAEENIRDEAAFYVPNVLSASSMDPENRVIKVYGDLKAEGFEFVVYDRRGMKVFTSDDLQRMQQTGWNGLSQSTGELLPQGSYVFAVRAQNQRDEPVEHTGTITVLR